MSRYKEQISNHKRQPTGIRKLTQKEDEALKTFFHCCTPGRSTVKSNMSRPEAETVKNLLTALNVESDIKDVGVSCSDIESPCTLTVSTSMEELEEIINQCPPPSFSCTIS